MSINETEFAKLIRQGDEKAFKNAFELYYAALVRYGNLFVHDTEISRGLVQEVFLKLWEKRDEIIIHSSLKAYLFTAINHKALNHIRHERVKETFKDQYISTWIHNDDNQLKVNPFLKDALENAINSLPPKAYKSFALTQIDGLSIREAAKKMGVAEKTIENQLARSRKTLRQKLKKFKN